MNARVEASPARPLWRQVEEHLKELIRSGELQPGQRLPTHQRFGQQLRVSGATLQRALTSLARQGLVERRPRVGTIVSHDPTPTVMHVGVMTRSLFDTRIGSVDRLLARALVAHLDEHEEPYRFYHTHVLPDAPAAALHEIDPILRRDVADGHVKALLVVGRIPELAADFRAELVRLEVPVVEMSAFTDPASYAVVPDSEDFARRACAAVVAAGRRRTAVLQLVDPDFPPPAWQQALWPQMLTGAGLVAAATPPLAAANERAGCAAMHAVWQQQPRPEAVIVADDVVASGVVVALLDLGIRVPDDLVVVTMTNKGSARLFPRAFVQLEMDIERWVAEAVRMLFDRLEGRRLGKRRLAIPFTPLNPDAAASATEE